MISKNAYLILTLLVVFFSSCKNSNDLSKQFSCDASTKFRNTETVADFNKSFSVKLPKHWNTKLYYDNLQSEIFSADTLKNLSDSYIMDFAMIHAPLDLSESLREKIHQKNTNNLMKTAQESFHQFKGYPAYANLGIGKSRGADFHVFQYYVKTSEETYMMIKTEFYGSDNFETRFCDALQLIDKITINK